MKITLVSNNFHPLTGGGEAERTYKLAEQLIQLNHHVSLITMDDQLPESRKTSLKFKESIYCNLLFNKYRLPLFNSLGINIILSKTDVVHIMGHWSFLNVIIFFICKIRKIPFLITPAGSFEPIGRSVMFKKIFNQIIGNKIIQSAEKVIAITKNELDTLLEKAKLNKSKLIIIPNGVSENDFPKLQSSDFKEKYKIGLKKYILFIGRINYVKGTDILVEAFTHFLKSRNDFNLVIAGPDGGIKQKLIDVVIQNKLTNEIHFLPVLRGHDKVLAFQGAEFICIPSRHEAMSIVALEAGICKKTVVLTDQCGFEEIHTYNLGWETKDNSADLYETLIEATLNEEEYIKRGLSLYSYVKNNFEWTLIINKYVDLFNQSIHNE